MCLSKEGNSSFHVPFFTPWRSGSGSAQPCIHQIAILINASIQIAPFSLDSNVGFIDKLNLADLALAFGSQLVNKNGGKAFFPITNCFVGKLKPSQSEKFCNVTKAQLIP